MFCQSEEVTQAIIEAVKSYFDPKFQAISIGNKPDLKAVALKKKGNQYQINHQIEILTELEHIKFAVNNNDIEQAKEHIEVAEQSVRKRIKLIKFADYGVIKAEQGLILMAKFRIPTRKFTHSLYSFTPVVHYYPDEDQFCKLDEGAEALVWTDSGSVAHISQQQLSQCQKSNELILCD